MKNKKINNRELIVNSLNNEFDNRGIKKYTKKELKNMISLEDFILKYYDRYDFYVCFDNYRYDSILFVNYYIDSKSKWPVFDRTFIFNDRFNNDVEVIKFIDEYRLDEIYLYKDLLYDSIAVDESYYLDGIQIYFSYYSNRIVISISRLILKGAI